MVRRAKRAEASGSADGRPRSLFRDFRVVEARTIERNPKNWRAHPPFQREVLRDALREIGFAGALLCYEPEPATGEPCAHARTLQVTVCADCGRRLE